MLLVVMIHMITTPTTVSVVYLVTVSSLLSYSPPSIRVIILVVCRMINFVKNDTSEYICNDHYNLFVDHLTITVDHVTISCFL